MRLTNHKPVYDFKSHAKNKFIVCGDTAIMLCHGPRRTVCSVLIDTKDIPSISQSTWRIFPKKHSTYVICGRKVGGKHKTLYLHRELINPPEGMFVDHRNFRGTDNRRCNLRQSTVSQNTTYSHVRSDNALGVKGVYLNRKKDRFTAKLSGKNCKRIVGTFDTLEEAKAAYDAAAKAEYGEFAYSG